ncbi:nucleoside deaminase [Bifidobacterium sp. ESL0745]|uniref:nucleoside deaminase n=1 Tax=Bifidobacterium sp. ESL0745 TaxID=2983226 RepID=UPI0032AFD475
MLQNNLQKTHVMRIDDSRISGNEMNGEISADDADIEDSADSESAGENRNVSMENAWNLADCTLVVTLEPCPMCAGAALQTHIGCIVFGAWDAKLGACGSVWDIPRDPHVGARPEIIGGLREAECAGLLAQFFACRR